MVKVILRLGKNSTLCRRIDLFRIGVIMIDKEMAEEYAIENDETYIVGWLASQSDMLAEDWKIVKPTPFKDDF